jgi:hypothetical protein
MSKSLTIVAVLVAVLFVFSAPQIGVAWERQPHMEAALHHLEQAAQELQAAEHDKGGHRAKALELTNQAIAHVREGIGFANHH